MHLPALAAILQKSFYHHCTPSDHLALSGRPNTQGENSEPTRNSGDMMRIDIREGLQDGVSYDAFIIIMTRGAGLLLRAQGSSQSRSGMGLERTAHAGVGRVIVKVMY